MASVCIFNPKKFYEMLASTENIDEKLRTFRNRCEGNDMYNSSDEELLWFLL
jgi:hypothetical protein